MENQRSTCQSIEESLSAYHDAELEAEERSQVEQHLSSCKDCTDKLRSLSRVISGVKDLPKLNVSVDFSAKLDAALAKQSKSKQSPIHFWLPIAAAAAVIVIAGLNLKQPTAQTPMAQLPRQSAPLQVQPATQSVEAIAQAPAAEDTVARSAGEQNAVARHAASQSREAASKVATPSPAAEQIADTMLQPGSNDEELAELPSTSNAFSEAVGLATDEDGLYDLKM